MQVRASYGSFPDGFNTGREILAPDLTIYRHGNSAPFPDQYISAPMRDFLRFRTYGGDWHLPQASPRPAPRINRTPNLFNHVLGMPAVQRLARIVSSADRLLLNRQTHSHSQPFSGPPRSCTRAARMHPSLIETSTELAPRQK